MNSSFDKRDKSKTILREIEDIIKQHANASNPLTEAERQSLIDMDREKLVNKKEFKRAEKRASLPPMIVDPRYDHTQNSSPLNMELTGVKMGLRNKTP